MYSWGSASNGELGQGGVEDAYISIPTFVKKPDIKPSSISIGGRHCLVKTETGELYSCGSNDFGQLGRESSQTRLELVTALSEYTVRSISAGSNHSLAADDWGSVFSWGSDEYGQLGHNQGSQTLRVPRLIKALGTIKIDLVSAGMYHSAVLTAGGQVYTWGNNSKGQLGLGQGADHVFNPKLVESLAGVPLAGLTCGGNHTLVVTLSGAVFSFGSNTHGQLGVGDTQDRYLPTQIRTLRKQNISPAGLAAGSEHSIALTSDGGVFTWGSSRCGQLGHGTTSSEILPRQILELMGTLVTQVAAGDRHTLALVPSRNKLYAFGVAGSGQLGRGRENNQNSTLPQIVSGDINGRIGFISAGGNSSWLAVTDKENSQLDQDPSIRRLNQSLLKKISEIKKDEILDQDLLEEVELIFSTLSCINASLLTPTHSGCSGSNPGVDFAAWKDAFSTIQNCNNDTISSAVMSGLLSCLEQIKLNPPDTEALRFFLVFPLHSSMMDPSCAMEFQVPYAEKLMLLQGNAIKVLEKWIGKSPKDWFLNLLTCYKDAAVPFLKLLNLENFEGIKVRALSVILVFLTFLSRVNTESGNVLSYETFYIPNIHEYCDLKLSYFSWKMARMRGQDTTVEFYICNFPFIFDPIAKEIVLRSDQEFTQQIAQQNAVQDAMFQMIASGQGMLNPFLEIFVSRNNIVQDTIAQLLNTLHTRGNFKKPLRITFHGEEAQDAGGVTKEFFLLLMKEILNPDYGMFKEYEETNTVWFNPASFETSEYFTMIGIVCGLAIYNFTIINLPFPLALYKKLLEEKTEEISDLADLSPTVAKSLQDLLDYSEPDVEEVFCLNFTITESYFGELVAKPLKPDGENMSVNSENKVEYVNLYVNYMLNSCCQEQFEAFKNGFLTVVNKQVLLLFQAKELMALVIGNENYDWDKLEESCQYKEGFTKDHQTIQFFWEAFRELEEEEKRKFLLFLTGSDRIPARGMESVQITIQRTGDVNCLPVAHTCFNLLDLPEYATKEKLKFKLRQAILETKGFGIV